MKIEISREDFGTLCICALRYCHGRRTYMPSLVQKIVGTHLKELSDKDIGVMVNDAEYRNGLDIRLYGEAEQDWLTFEEKVRTEQANRIIVRDMLKGGAE